MTLTISCVPIATCAGPGDGGYGSQADVGVDIPDEIDTSRIVMTFDRPMVEVVDGESVVTLGDLNSLYVPMRPDIPFGNMELTFDVDFRLVDVLVEPGKVEELSLQAPIRCHGKPLAIGFDGPFLYEDYDVDPYDGDLYPETWGSHRIGRGIDDMNDPTVYLTFFVHPVRVQGDSLLFTREMTITFTHYSAAAGSRDDDSRAEEYKLVIIGPSSFSIPIMNLVHHKHALGLTTRFVSTDDIYAGTHFQVQGSTNAEKIKHFIKDAYDNWDTRFVLLFGDVAQIPAFYVPYTDSYTTSVPTDIYYADVIGATGSFSDWSSASGSYSSYNMPDDLYIDVHTGRLPADTIDEANTVVNKVITYENDTDKGGWFKTAVLIGTDPFGGGGAEGEIGMDFIGNIIEDDFTNIKKLYVSNSTATATQISNAINGGAGIVTYAGHGMNTYLAIGGGNSFSVSHINALTNGNKLGIGSQAACLTGYYDMSGHSYSETWVLKNGGGGIANMGASRVAYGAYGNGWPMSVSGALNNRLYSSLVGGRLTAGAMYTGAHTNYMNTIGVNGGTDFKTVIEYNWFADPSMVIGVSVDFSMETPGLLLPGEQNTFNISVTNDGLPLGLEVTSDPELVPEGWEVSFIPQTFTLQGGSSTNVRVRVTPDQFARAGIAFQLPISIKAPSLERTLFTNTVDLEVSKVYGMEIVSDYPKIGTAHDPGDEVDIEFEVKNLGNGEEEVDLELEGVPQDWSVTLEEDTVALDWLENRTININIKIPEKCAPSSNSILVKGSVAESPDKDDDRLFNIAINTIHSWDVRRTTDNTSVDMGSWADYVIELVNDGNVPETIELNMKGPPKWSFDCPDEVMVDPYSVEVISVKAEVPGFEYTGNYTIEISADNRATGTSVDLELGLDVNAAPGLTLTAVDEVIEVPYMDSGEAALLMHNTGNSMLDVDISVPEAPEGWTTEFDIDHTNISAQQSVYVTLFVENPEFTVAGDYILKVATVATFGTLTLENEVNITVTVGEYRNTTAYINTDRFTADPGDILTTRLTLDNMGNFPETFSDMNAVTSNAWKVKMTSTEETVDPFSNVTLDVIVTIPEDTREGMYRVTLFAKNDPNNFVFTIDVRINHIFAIESALSRESVQLMPKQSQTVYLNISNLGNGDDDIRILMNGTDWVLLDKAVFDLAPNGLGTAVITVSPFEYVEAGLYTISFKVESEGGEVQTHELSVKVDPLPDPIFGGKGGAVWGLIGIILAIAVACIIAAFVVHRRRAGTGSGRGDMNGDASRVADVPAYRSFEGPSAYDSGRSVSLLDIDNMPDLPDDGTMY